VQTAVLSVNSITYGCSWLCWTCMHTVVALTAFFCALPKPVKGIGLAVQAVNIQSCHPIHKQSGCTVLRCGVASHLQCMPYRVYDGIEAPEMANEQLSAGYYYPNPKHDIWSFGLLLFFVLKGIGHLPHEHQTALQNGNTLLFANKLCDQGKYTTWWHKVNSVARPDSMNVCLSLRLRF